MSPQITIAEMKMLVCSALCATLSLSSAAAAEKKNCPFHEAGYYPWQAEVPRLVKGDLWAWVYLDIDKRGYPRRCYIGKNNMAEGTRSNTCRSFVRGWRATPLLKDGVPTAGTIERFFIVMGDKHLKLLEEAKKRWAASHPEDNPDCYHG